MASPPHDQFSNASAERPVVTTENRARQGVTALCSWLGPCRNRDRVCRPLFRILYRPASKDLRRSPYRRLLFWPKELEAPHDLLSMD
jgi:hypothetical protein